MLCALAFLCAAMLLVSGCVQRPSAGIRAEEAAKSLDTYAFDLVFCPEDCTLAITMTLSLRNRTSETLDRLVLRTWGGAFCEEATSPTAIAELFSLCYPEGFSAGGIRLDGAWWNGEIVPAAFTDNAKTVLQVDIPSFSKEADGTLLLRLLLRVPACAYRYGVSGGVWHMGNALPILAVYADGAWREDAYSPIGDPFLSACANYDVTLTVPEGYVCAASGRIISQTTQNGQTIYSIRGRALREFAFALSDCWQQATVKQQGVTISCFAKETAAAKRAAKQAAKVLHVFEGLYGAYPYDTLTLCAAEFPFGGMEYPSLLFLDAAYFYEDLADSLELIIAHETAHQWFYALVGSDQVRNPWQDEALSEYAMLQYVKKVYGQSAHDDLKRMRVDACIQEYIPFAPSSGAPITDFSTYAAYSSVVYGRGAAMLLSLDSFFGRVNEFLHAYCDKYAFHIASRADFEHLLQTFSEEDPAPLIADYLDTTW